MADPVFKFDGKYSQSSEIPTIKVGDKEITREAFQKQQIDSAVKKLPDLKEGEKAVYVATGGGYESFNTLVAYEKGKGKIADVKSVKGNDYRELPEFKEEKERLRTQLTEFIGPEKLKANPNAVEQAVSAFYSNEVNTLIGKKIVLAAIDAGKSSAYESASIYDDSFDRVKAAKDKGIKTVLIAGDRNFAKAITDSQITIEPGNTAKSYKEFSSRFKRLTDSFDEVRLYSTDAKEPKLIAEKTDKGLKIVDEDLYKAFLIKAMIDPEKFKSATAEQTNKIWQDHVEAQNKAVPPGQEVPKMPMLPLPPKQPQNMPPRP